MKEAVNTKTSRSTQMRYPVIFETGPEGGVSAYVPDLPGCVAAASSLEETRKLIREAVKFHLEGMRLHGETVPEPTAIECSLVEIA